MLKKPADHDIFVLVLVASNNLYTFLIIYITDLITAVSFCLIPIFVKIIQSLCVRGKMGNKVMANSIQTGKI